MQFNSFVLHALCISVLALDLSACSGAPSVGSSAPLLLSQTSLSETTPAMPTGGKTMPPPGLLGFCVKYLTDCATTTNNVAAVDLTSERFHQLQSIQSGVNAAIVATAIPDNVWDYPIDG